jgi:hypothetical protein
MVTTVIILVVMIPHYSLLWLNVDRAVYLTREWRKVLISTKQKLLMSRVGYIMFTLWQ